MHDKLRLMISRRLSMAGLRLRAIRYNASCVSGVLSVKVEIARSWGVGYKECVVSIKSLTSDLASWHQ